MAISLSAGGREIILLRGLTEESLAFIESDWTPLTVGQPDADWRWREIVATHQGQMFSLKSGDILIGVLLLTAGAPMSLELDGGAGVMVEYMAGAPWCRGGAFAYRYPRVPGVGLQMIAVAVAFSVALGYEGRLCFFSENPTVGWYRARLPGLVGFGERWDGERALPYFEWPGEAARRFLGASGLPDLSSLVLEDGDDRQ